jgi:acyl-[acyl-carrier-protein]-phospholipid O-acyltransferase / long-chain-fatty-acid--[acyl-carrier-protein] ligase
MKQEPRVGPTAPILFATLLETALDYAWAWGIAVLLLVVIVCVFRYFFLVRLPLWVLRHTLYRVRVHGLENVPATGPALLVSNHVSFIDAIVILAAQRRRIRFLTWAPFTGVPGLRLFLRLVRVIPIDSRAGPRAIIESLRTASDALTAGEVVCIFAEGGITHTGFLLPFARGFEQIVKRSPVPIVPVCVDHVWGSIFSYQGGSVFWKVPRQLPYVVHVNFGAPLPPTSDSFTVRQAIQKLSADSAIRRGHERKPVHRQFVRMAVRHPLRLCFIDPSNTARPLLKYSMALTGVKMLMRRLRPLVGDDAMVGLWLPPSTGAAIANIALACMGKTSVNLNYTSAPNIVQSAIRQCNIRKVLTSRLFTHRLPLDAGPGVELVYLEDFRKTISKWEIYSTLAGVWLLPGFIHEYWLMGLGKHAESDLATVIFSSGSTGDPKGVMLTHGNIAANAESVIQAIDPQSRDRLLAILPFFHSFGYTVTLWLPLQIGCSVVYHPNPLQAREIGELCRTHQCTIFLTTPTFLRSYLRRCEPADFATVRILVCGAEKLPLALAKEFKDKFAKLPLEGYGCTELSPVATLNVPDWEEGSQRQVGNKPGTIGQPLPGVAASIVHRETRAPLPAGQEGLLLIRGANVMKGYLDRDDLTQKKVIDGWYVTGDLARMDDDGFISITGREERFAKVGGEMVPLEKVEDEIQEVLGGTEKHCAVTAIPDAAKGERLVVLHLPLPGITVPDVRKRLSERGLPNIYVPGQRDFFEVAELPMLGSGKLDLKKCKELAMQLAGAVGE